MPRKTCDGQVDTRTLMNFTKVVRGARKFCRELRKLYHLARLSRALTPLSCVSDIVGELPCHVKSMLRYVKLSRPEMRIVKANFS